MLLVAGLTVIFVFESEVRGHQLLLAVLALKALFVKFFLVSCGNVLPHYWILAHVALGSEQLEIALLTIVFLFVQYKMTSLQINMTLRTDKASFMVGPIW